MKFGETMEDLAENGGKARRREWTDQKIYVTFVDEKLMILGEDNLLHPLIISSGDVLNGDWEKFKLKVVQFKK